MYALDLQLVKHVMLGGGLQVLPPQGLLHLVRSRLASSGPMKRRTSCGLTVGRPQRRASVRIVHQAVLAVRGHAVGHGPANAVKKTEL